MFCRRKSEYENGEIYDKFYRTVLLRYEYTLADVIDEFYSYEEAFNLFEKIEKSDPLQTVIIVERIADTEITDKTQLAEGKTYWVAAD